MIPLHAFFLDLKPVRTAIALEVAVVLLCSIITTTFYSAGSRSIAFMVTLALVSFLPLIIGILTVGGASRIESAEIIATSVRGLKGELTRRFASLLTVGIIMIILMYSVLSLFKGWPRNDGISTLVSYVLGVVIVALCGLLAILLAQPPKVALLAVVISWIGLTFVVDPYILSFLIARITPLVLLFFLAFIAFRRLEDGKLLVGMEE